MSVASTGTITSGTGLVSGINTASLIQQLIAIDAQPQTLVKNQVAQLQAQKTAFLDISAQLLGLQTSVTGLGDPNLFQTKVASSSNSSVLSATATNTAAVGTYNFTPRRLVSNHSLISRGYADADSTPVTTTDTTLTFESANARLDDDTSLSTLRGGAGIQRGTIRITDRTGAKADIDLTAAVTLGDVVDAINNASGINVSASVEGDHLKLTDNTGATVSNFSVANLGSTTTATSLGIVGSTTTSSLAGTQINFINADTRLSGLNDGNGVREKGTGQNDLVVNTQDGHSFNVILFGAATVGDVINQINSAGNGSVTASVGSDGVSLQVKDNTTSNGSAFSIADASGSHAASDLGLVGADTDHDGTIAGSRLLATLGSKLLKNLNGGSGVGFASGSATLAPSTPLSKLFGGAGLPTTGDSNPDISFTDRDGQTLNVDLDSVGTVQNLIDKVNDTFAGNLTVGINGQSLTVTDTSTGSGNFTVADLTGSTAAAKLGITIDSDSSSPSTVAGVDTQPLNQTTIQITNRHGDATAIDLSGASSVTDVITKINAAAAGVTASLNSAGNGLLLTDTTGSTNSNLIVSDGNGSAATDLGIATAPAGVASTTDEGHDLSFAWINENTRLDTLNANKGVAAGTFRITDSTGASATVDLTNISGLTLKKVIAVINSRPTGIRAAINSTGDGLVLTDTAGGPLPIKVTEGSATTAADLNLLKTPSSSNVIDGAYKQTVAISAGDTLSKVVDKINAAGTFVSASVVNDGSSSTPFRLTLSSKLSGSAGRIVVDDGTADFQSTDLVKGDDSVVLFGSADPAKALLLTSSTNTLTNTVQGVTINLQGTSTAPVELTISRDDNTISSSINTFVTSFNSVLSTMDKYDTFDTTTNTAGLLLGDPTVSLIRSRLLNLVNSKVAGVTGQFNFLAQVGVSIGANAQLTFDQDRFSTALDSDPAAVSQLFTATTTAASSTTTTGTTLPTGVSIPASSTQTSIGIGKLLIDALNKITDSTNGTLTLTTNNIDAQVQLGNDRIAQLQTLLDAKQASLQTEFNDMETALAQLQSQSSALSSLSSAG